MSSSRACFSTLAHQERSSRAAVAGLVQMLEFLDLLALLQDLDEVPPDDVDGIADRRHLQLDCMEPQLFDRPRAADAAVAHEGDRLAVPFGVGVVERVLQNRGGTTACIRLRSR